jgi:adenylate cyclase
MSVRCSGCGTENPDGAKFCKQCGAALARSCPHCGAAVPVGARFCVECGNSLPNAPAAAPATRDSLRGAAPAEERRKATVLFADLSGYTAIAERLDPEQTKTLIEQALERLSREVVDRDGYVDKYIGDNVMAVFGAPVTHEDDAERAVRAGLAMQAAMTEINARLGERASSRDAELSLRVGINSGEVLAGRVGEQYTVIGDAVNVAARLQAAGPPGQVTVGAPTRRMTADSIEYRALEPLALKGKAEPIPAWEAVAAKSPVGGSAKQGQTAPLIGRDEERALLLSLCDRVLREGRPHLVTIFGEAGVGKTRLLNEIATAVRARPEPVEILIGRSPPYGAATTYAALAEIVRERFGIAETDDLDAAISRLSEGIMAVSSDATKRDATRAAALIARTLGFDVGDEGLEGVEPEQVRERIFAAVRALLESVSARTPLLVGIEDIHWAHEGMLDLIEHIAAWGGGPMLIVVLAREELLERRTSWGGGRRNATTISLDPLSEQEAGELVRALLGGHERHGELAAGVASRSGGNPLFAEEMVKRLREEESDDLDRLPESVHAVIAARLDALRGDERGLLQAASVVGESFSEATVAELLGAGSIAAGLEALVEKDLLSPADGSALPGDREFTFKHALVRDVAYGTVPRAARARQHSDVATILERRAGGNQEAIAALLAEHLARAVALAEQADYPPAALDEMRVEAAGALERAGDVAASLYSNAEALGDYEDALRLPGGLTPEGRARVEEKRGDTAFRSGHVDSAIAAWTRALDHQRQAGRHSRAGELHRKLGTGHWHKGDRKTSIAEFQEGIDLLKDGEPCRELIELYEEAASLYVETGDNMLALYAAEKAQRLAETLGQADTASRAHLTFGRIFGRIGDLEQARRSLERSVELARQTGPAETVRALLALGRHLEVTEADYAAAARACREALSLADRLGDVPAQIELRAALGQLAVHSADWPEVEQHAAQTLRLAEREGLSGQICLSRLLQGISAWRLGQWQRAETALRDAHEVATAGGRSEVAFSALLWLAYCRADQGDLEAAEEDLTRADEVCERAGLVAQAAEATAARAAVLDLQGRGREAAALAAALDRKRTATHPVGRAQLAESLAAAELEPGSAAEGFTEAIAAWEEAGRPLNAIRARMLLARALRRRDPAAAATLLEQAAAEADRHGVAHLDELARSEAGEGPGQGPSAGP